LNKKSRPFERLKLFKLLKDYASSSSSSSPASAPLTAPRAILTETTTAFAGSKKVTPGISIDFTVL